MKNLLITLALFFALSGAMFGQKSILDFRIGDYVDVHNINKTLAVSAMFYHHDKFNNSDVYNQVTYISEINPEIQLTDNSITSINFKFNCGDKDIYKVLEAFYLVMCKIEGGRFWNHDSDNRYFKNNRDGTFIDIYIQDNCIIFEKYKVKDI